jgi:hypothetical protein
MGVTFGRVKPFSVRPHGTEMHFCPWMSIVLLLAFLTSPGTAQIFNALYEFQGNSDGALPTAAASSIPMLATTAVVGSFLKSRRRGRSKFCIHLPVEPAVGHHWAGWLVISKETYTGQPGEEALTSIAAEWYSS